MGLAQMKRELTRT